MKNISITSESNKNTENFISLQICTEIDQHLFVLLIITNEYYSIIKEVINDEELIKYYQEKNIKLTIQPTNEENNFEIFIKWIKDLIDLNKNTKFNLHFYDSFKDLIYFFGWDSLKEIIENSNKNKYKSYLEHHYCWKGMIEKTYLNQNQNINLKFILKDKNGWSDKGLLSLLSTFGIEHSPFDTLTIYNEDGSINLTDKKLTISWIESLIQNVIGLSQTTPKMRDFLNEITSKILKLKMETYTTENLPNTIGGITSKILIKYLENSFESGERFLKIIRTYGFDQEFLSNPKRDKSKIINTPLTAGSIKSFSENEKTSGIFNSILHGGRIYNEQWREYYKENTADIDIVGCYGNILKDLDYPLGIPTIYEVGHIDHSMTLRTFLNKYKSVLIDNLYTITISGKLSYSQSLLYSKIIDVKEIKKILNRKNKESNFVLLENELSNTLLTSEILDTLQKICSNQELKEIYDCRVITAVYYSKKDLIENREEWLDYIENDYLQKDRSLLYVDNKKNLKIDKRSKKWCRIPLKNLITPLIEKRQQIKSTIKDDTNLSLENRGKLEGLQQMIKLIINTCYGIISSQYHDVGNTILANNITAKARTAIWLYSRVLNGIQCITDGFQYQPENIIKLKKNKTFRKPGLNELSDLYRLKQNNNVKLGNLNDIDWNQIFNNPGKENINKLLDQAANEHIQNFLAVYKIKPGYDMEHKENHTGLKTFYCKKANYITLTLEDDIVYKVRGESESELNPYKQIAISLFENKKLGFDSLSHQTKRINNMDDYLNSLKKYYKNNEEKILIPGYSRTVTLTFQITNEDLPYKNQKEYIKRKIIDYAPLLLEENTWEEVMKKRLQDYDKNNNKPTTTKKR
jgi:hypothetical protein